MSSADGAVVAVAADGGVSSVVGMDASIARPRADFQLVPVSAVFKPGSLFALKLVYILVYSGMDAGGSELHEDGNRLIRGEDKAP